MPKFAIGYRTIKTALGTPIAIWIAQLLQLDHFVSAGIITVLCIQITKKRSIQSAWARFLACSIAVLFSALIFEIIGYHPISIGLLLLLFIPTTVMLKVKEGIVTSTVIILHVYSAGKITFDLFLNELLLILIGIGVALLMNVYMPSLEKKLEAYRNEIEQKFSQIFCEIINFLLNGDSDWDGKEITETAQLLEEARTLALRNVENQVLRHEDIYYHYFKMREKQFEIIERVLPTVASISANVEQAEIVAQYIEELRTNIHPGNTAQKFLRKLHLLSKQFQEMPLPNTREEFETRAALFHFLNEMEQYLIIKSQYKGYPYDKNQ
ncbi:aromatic acid exporter family protein [Bacillus sp. FJAT-47783]|uniref:aromatic acid exporter family protein n=1 Tax=Bacillus sp. FJAT-47783 TaxID=2922712 RepID=UPI001FAC825E|nr:aromatic acid exporter family protein [Bacillus sp. FJAT-47783]